MIRRRFFLGGHAGGGGGEGGRGGEEGGGGAGANRGGAALSRGPTWEILFLRCFPQSFHPFHRNRDFLLPVLFFALFLGLNLT